MGKVNMPELRSEHISKRLFSAILVILFSLLLISIPLVIRSYQDYQKNKQAQQELYCLKSLADLANMISRERAPANQAMSSVAQDGKQKYQILLEYRKGLDKEFKQTVEVLNRSGFQRVAYFLETDVKASLQHARYTVDAFSQLTPAQRNPERMDAAILAMFQAWDRVHHALQRVVNQSHGKETAVSNYYTLILLMTEFRDQAGRTGSNVMSSLTFNTAIPATNMARFLQTQRQSYYLWELVGVILPEHEKTTDFTNYHLKVKREFLEQSLPMVESLLNESVAHQPYSMSASELTEALVGKFSTVVDLQTYLINQSIEHAEVAATEARNRFLISLIISLIALTSTLFCTYYLRRYVFSPLIRARDLLLNLSQRDSEQMLEQNSASLFGAIRRVEDMLLQRDHFEFKLKNLANTDSLTGTSNRFALDEYIQLLESQPNRLRQTCLIMVDIDHFKQVNDKHGHILGDQVIQWVADKLKANVRASDLVVRYGGDEFMVLIENIDLAYAMNVAEKFRAEIVVARFLDANDVPIPISVSIGVAVGASRWLSLFEKADKALFRAKTAGRNSVSS